jgi:hypothetical protein
MENIRRTLRPEHTEFADRETSAAPQRWSKHADVRNQGYAVEGGDDILVEAVALSKILVPCLLIIVLIGWFVYHLMAWLYCLFP